MSYDIPSISELEAIQLLNKHYAEVVTSKKDGIASGSDITQTTNPITGVVRRTLYKILDDMDDTFLERLLKMAFTPVGTFTSGATLTDARQTLLWEVSKGGDGRYYSWSGSFGTSGKIVTAGSTPSEPKWVDRTDDSLRDEIRETVFQNMKRLAAEAGYNLVDGSFQIGAVTVNTNDVVWDWVSGKYYGGVIGSVSAGSTPATSGAWVDRTDVTLRSDLADVDSSVLISGERASDIALRASGDDYTLIQPSAKFIEATIGSSTQYLECVITGDSLSFNAFGYPVGWSTNGGAYATDNPFGLSSWSHIIRDLWVSSSNGFTPIDKVLVSTDTTPSYLSLSSVQHIGMNGKAVAFSFSDTSKKLTISAPGNGVGMSLIVSYAPRADAVNFTVNGISYSNETPVS